VGSHGVDGVILARIMNPAVYECFPWDRFVVVSTEVTRLVEGFDVVRPSYFAAMLELQREIWRRGYRRIGVWLREHEEAHPDDEARMGAALLFQCETGVALPVKSANPRLAGCGIARRWCRVAARFVGTQDADG